MPKIHALHPNTAFFGLPREAGTFVEDVKRWGRMIRGQLGPDLQNAKANGTVADFESLRQEGLGGVPLAVDIETGAATKDEPWTGKDPTRARLKTIAIGTAERGVSVVWDDATPLAKLTIREILTDAKIVKVFQNGYWFDIPVLARYDLPVVNVEDIRDRRRALSSTSKLSLRYQGSLYCDIPNWKDDEKAEAGDGKFWDSDDLESLQVYNAQDTIVTARVDVATRRDAGDDERVAKLYEMHKKLSIIAASMYQTGIYVHRPWRNFMVHATQQRFEETRENLRRLIGDEDFPCTDHSMRALIYKRHEKDGIKCFGLPDPYDKKMWTNEHKETISVDESSLISLIVGGACPPELLPIIEAYWDLQSEKKRLGYLQSKLIDQAIGLDGRLRPGWNSCGTDTGRFSCFTGDTLVTTTLGPKRIDEVQVGDHVWTHERRWRPVTQVFAQGMRAVCAYKFNTGASVICTTDHKFLCSDGSWRAIQEIANDQIEIMGSSARESTGRAQPLPQEQRIGQSGIGHEHGTQSHSFSAGERQRGIFVTEIHSRGFAEVFDLEVAEDHSFEVSGVLAHNCSQPNVMNIEQLLRHMLAPAPGMAIVHADKSQLEIRVMQVVAADMVLMDGLNSGDLYSSEARGYFNIPQGEKVKKPARQSAKIIRLARQYGAGLSTVYSQALRMDRTFTLSRCQLLMKQFDTRYYRTVAYWKEEMERVLACGYSESRLMGRRRTYPRPPELSETVNYPIQSTASDMMNLEMIELYDRLAVECPRAHIIIQLHDAIDVECPEQDVPMVERIIDEVMDREWTICGVTRKFGIERKTTYASKEGTWADV